MAWEIYSGRGPQTDGDPQLSVRSDGTLYLNASADRQWFADVDVVTILLDPDAGRLAVAPGDQGGMTLITSRDHQFGFQVGSGGAVRELGADTDALDAAERFDLAWDESIEAAVADLRPLLEDRDTAESETADEDEPSPADADTGDTLGKRDDGGSDADDQDDVADDQDSEAGQDVENPRGLLADWVRKKVSDGNAYMLESREIAEDLPLSGSQVGAHMRYLRDELDSVDIEHIPKDANEAFDRGKWRLESREEAPTEPSRRFGPDKHETANGELSDALVRDLASAETTVVGLADAHPDLTPLKAKRLNQDLDLGLADNVEGRGAPAWAPGGDGA